jgi:hypothetical protein
MGQLFAPDSLTGATQAFQSKNVMGLNGSTVTVTGYTVNDTNGGANYTVTPHTVLRHDLGGAARHLRDE